MIKHPLQINSILYSSWGYDQTNINFYQVIELVGNATVVLRELAQEMAPLQKRKAVQKSNF
ncbi:hypothetical protein [Fluoribacter dumoffii]|uniref:Uncharacterized protein n=1 Tax=Fluoribacter dumoffii TaxID=463 RepID=A0A377IUL2_9GAMM|nr:hypothetical protein [Fluoribacter dumoffii]STO91553.1 Uncharacterised protein [Fluoribacter dumoffii]